MKSIKQFAKTLILGAALAAGASTAANAGGVLNHSAQASGHSVQAVAHGVAAIGKTALSVTALPFVAVGAAGGLSERAGDAMLEAANTPLPIGDAFVTAGPAPNEALNSDTVAE